MNRMMFVVALANLVILGGCSGTSGIRTENSGGGKSHDISVQVQSDIDRAEAGAASDKMDAASDKMDAASDKRSDASEENMQVDLSQVTEFVLLLAEEEKRAEYEKAAAVIFKEKGISGKVAEVSMRFGHWFLIEFENTLDNPPLDDDVFNTAFVVNMAENRMVSAHTGEHELFHRVTEVIPQVKARKQERLINFMTGFACAILFQHTRYVGSDGSEQTYAPVLEKNPESSKLTFYVVKPGTGVEYEKHAVEISADGVKYDPV
ncbi:MAG: hypothetical protein J6S69_05020 [Proteobacteria bacterium]|nr:hypothetical protein [Pseudomonadota bacterium]